MQPRHSIIIIAMALAAGISVAQEAVEPAAPAAMDASLAQLRDPFWPVGWVPPKLASPVRKTTTPEMPQGPVRWEEVTHKLEVSALSQSPDGTHIAVLKNIGLVEAGDTISVNYGGLTYRWEVLAITAAGIETKRLGVSVQQGK